MNKTLSILFGLAAYSNLAQDIEITPVWGYDSRIREPGKQRIAASQPIVLTPASDFNVEYKTNRVEIRKIQTVRWNGSLQKQYEDAVRQVISLEDHAAFYGQKLDRSAFASLYRSWGQPECTWTTERSTNWVGLQNQWRQVGIITEETKLKVIYNGQTNVFTLESKEVATTGPREMSWQRTNDINNFIWYNYNGNTN